jgi:hypothetical protein
LRRKAIEERNVNVEWQARHESHDTRVEAAIGFLFAGRFILASSRRCSPCCEASEAPRRVLKTLEISMY